jgi:hypothetical protein
MCFMCVLYIAQLVGVVNVAAIRDDLKYIKQIKRTHYTQSINKTNSWGNGSLYSELYPENTSSRNIQQDINGGISSVNGGICL